MNSLEFFKSHNTVPSFLTPLVGPKGKINYISFSTKPIVGMTSYAAKTVIETFLPNIQQSMAQWKRDKSLYYTSGYEVVTKMVSADENYPLGIKHERGRMVRSKDFNYLSISNYIRNNGYFDNTHFNLPDRAEHWLDGYNEQLVSMPITIPFTTDTNSNHDVTTHRLQVNMQKQFGAKFPIYPTIKREGFIVNHFLPFILSNVQRLRIKLIENSINIFSSEWLFDFKNIVNDCISSVDIALNSLYIKAQFNPLPEWTFNPEKLGVRHGRRMVDKLKWVHQISGNNFDILEQENSFNYLRELRNHLNHFDPPCLALTVEECVDVLNMIIDIGIIHIKMRKSLKVEASNFLINFILQPEAVINTEFFHEKRRKFDNKSEGYSTSIWPNA